MRLILDTHDAAAFTLVAPFTVRQPRDWLLSEAADAAALTSDAAWALPA